jgi:hypothetical protein
MKTWMVLLVAFLAGLMLFNPALDATLSQPSKYVATQLRVSVLQPFYEAAYALDASSEW